MKGFVFLADAVSQNQDGTFSVLRGGIDKLQVPEGQPCVFRGGVVVRVVAAAGEVGDHDVKIMCVNEDGVSVLGPILGQLRINEPGGAGVAFNVHLVFPKPGRYSFTVTVDKHEVDACSLNVGTAKMNPEGR